MQSCLFLLMSTLDILGFLVGITNLSSFPYAKHFKIFYKHNFCHTINILCRKNAIEYNDQQLKQLYQQNGTISQLSCPYNSQQNGHAESKHRHILGIVRSFLITASFPKRFWREAAVTTLYAIMSPLFYHPQQNSLFLYCKSPTYTHFRVLGCACFVLLSLHERSNLESTSRLYCFFDYGIN